MCFQNTPRRAAQHSNENRRKRVKDLFPTNRTLPSGKPKPVNIDKQPFAASLLAPSFSSRPVTLAPPPYRHSSGQATMHVRDAFFAALLPHSVHGRVADIWRSYISQALMWQVGLRVAFAYPWVHQASAAVCLDVGSFPTIPPTLWALPT